MITYDGLRVLMMAEDDLRCCFGLFGPRFQPKIMKIRQGAYFVLDMSDYDDTTSTALVDQPLQVIRSLKVTNGGNPGDYSAGAPPVITVEDPNNFNLPTPLGPENILPEFSANVSAAGTITSIDVINSGRNYLPTQTLNVAISGEVVRLQKSILTQFYLQSVRQQKLQMLQELQL